MKISYRQICVGLILTSALSAISPSIRPVWAQPTAAPDAPKEEPKAPAKPAEPPVITTESGLKYQDLAVGEGATAAVKQRVTVDYRGTLEDGTLFDQSYGRAPFQFVLGAGRVIKGWDEGVQGMKVGGKRKLIIPSELGYGKTGTPGGPIPPNATLIFEIELLRAG